MDPPGLLPSPTAEEELALLALAEAAFSTQDINKLAELFLKTLVRLLDTPAALFYMGNNRLSSPAFLQFGLSPETHSLAETACSDQFCRLAAQGHPQPLPLHLTVAPLPPFTLYPLERKQSCIGLLGLAQGKAPPTSYETIVERARGLLCHACNNLLDRWEYENEIRNLNTYLSVSSMIAQALDLRDVLEAVLYFCMDAVTAEAASVLLLDYVKDNFRFYSAEGPSKPVLLMASFPANQGLAGAVLETQQPEVINDVQSDPRFYGKFDAESGFITRNMIALPLTAGDEKIGVLEVINKIEGFFTDEDLLLMQTVAEEIAFAVRNAKLFEVVVKSYCKQRQGLNTCKGCKRPLGSWTPCVKYREEAGILEV